MHNNLAMRGDGGRLSRYVSRLQPTRKLRASNRDRRSIDTAVLGALQCATQKKRHWEEKHMRPILAVTFATISLGGVAHAQKKHGTRQ